MKNHSNEIRSNKIRIRREPPVIGWKKVSIVLAYDSLRKKGDVIGLHLDNKWGWVITAMTFFLKSVWAAAEHSEAQSLFN